MIYLYSRGLLDHGPDEMINKFTFQTTKFREKKKMNYSIQFIVCGSCYVDEKAFLPVLPKNVF